MIRLHFVVEGQTEKAFVDTILAPYLAEYQIWADCRLVHTNWKLQAKGGMTTYARAKKDILQWIKEDKNTDARFTTMFDLYALPNDFPKFVDAMKKPDKYECVSLLETEFGQDIGDHRFIPYIQLHEFETLLFADIQKLDREFLEHENEIVRLNSLVTEVGNGNPELIDDGVTTAPSKRIIAEIPQYEKAKSSVGPIVAQKIGLNTMRKECHHFNQWVERLETLNSTTHQI